MGGEVRAGRERAARRWGASADGRRVGLVADLRVGRVVVVALQQPRVVGERGRSRRRARSCRDRAAADRLRCAAGRSTAPRPGAPASRWPACRRRPRRAPRPRTAARTGPSRNFAAARAARRGRPERHRSCRPRRVASAARGSSRGRAARGRARPPAPGLRPPPWSAAMRWWRDEQGDRVVVGHDQAVEAELVAQQVRRGSRRDRRTAARRSSCTSS